MLLVQLLGILLIVLGLFWLFAGAAFLGLVAIVIGALLIGAGRSRPIL